jgi:hypothetical protein
MRADSSADFTVLIARALYVVAGFSLRSLSQRCVATRGLKGLLLNAHKALYLTHPFVRQLPS